LFTKLRLANLQEGGLTKQKKKVLGGGATTGEWPGGELVLVLLASAATAAKQHTLCEEGAPRLGLGIGTNSPLLYHSHSQSATWCLLAQIFTSSAGLVFSLVNSPSERRPTHGSVPGYYISCEKTLFPTPVITFFTNTAKLEIPLNLYIFSEVLFIPSKKVFEAECLLAKLIFWQLLSQSK